MNNVSKIANEIKKSGDESEEGRIALIQFVMGMHSSGIYDAIQNISDYDLKKIKRYDSETSAKLLDTRKIIKDKIQSLVSDLNLWYKENE